jgi:hypothetical protein
MSVKSPYLEAGTTRKELFKIKHKKLGGELVGVAKAHEKLKRKGWKSKMGGISLISNKNEWRFT